MRRLTKQALQPGTSTSVMCDSVTVATLHGGGWQRRSGPLEGGRRGSAPGAVVFFLMQLKKHSLLGAQL